MTDSRRPTDQASRQRRGGAARASGLADALATRPAAGATLVFKRRLVEALLLVILACLVGVGWLTWRSMRAAADSDQRETHTRIVIQQLSDLLSSLKDAETGQRGFIITGRPDYLAPYRASLEALQTRLADLRRLTEDNPRQQQRLAAITPLVEEKLADLKESIALRQAQGFPAAHQAVMTESGKKIMDQIRVLVALAQEEEAQLLKDRVAMSLADTGRTTQSVLLGSTLGAVALLLLFIYLWWELARRRRADKALQESEQRLWLATDAAGLSIWTWQPDGDRLTWENERPYDILGIPRSEAPVTAARFAAQFAHPQDLAAFKQALADTAKSGARLFYQGRFHSPDGALRWLEFTGQAVRGLQGPSLRVIGTVRDITERQQAQQALLESQRLLRATFDGLSGHIAVLDESCTILAINEAWRRFALENQSTVAAVGVGVNYLQHCRQALSQGGEIPAYAAGIKDVIAGRRTHFEMEYPCHSPTEKRWYVMRVTRFQDTGPVRIVIVHDDCTERKLAEQASRESEERYRNLFNSMAQGFCIIDTIFDEHDKPVDYRFLEVNPAFEQKSGLHGVAGKRVRDVIPDLEAEWFEICGKVALTGEPVHFVKEVKALKSWLDIRAARLGRPESRQVAIIFNNLTERQKAEEAVRQSEVRWRFALQVAELGAWEFNLVDHTAWRSERYDQIFGYPSPLPSWTYEDFLRHVVEADRAAVDRSFQQAVSQQQDWLVECRIRRADGAERWIWGHGKIVSSAGGNAERMFGLVEDITAKKEAEQRLVESEERLRLAADAAHFGMYDRDLGGSHFHISAQIKQMLGYEPDAPLDYSQLLSHIHPDDRAAGLAAFQRACDPAGDGRVAFEQRIVRHDGEVRWIASIGRVLFEHGVPNRSIGFWLDITERRRLEQETLEQAQALADLDRRKDEFLAMLSHELRNPLAALANAVQLLRLQKNEAPLQQQARSIIERQVAQLKNLVDDLLDISRITTGRVRLRKERIAVRGVVERALETVEPLIAQRRHELTVSLPPQPVWLEADAARLEQVLVNLLTNAAKYTDEGGHIWLSVEQEGAAAVLKVRDTGIGIAPELLPRIFELFTQAERAIDRSQGGLGIGLCLVQRLVELHGGSVEAHSVLGQGSEFVVRLPVLPAGLPLTPPLIEPARAPGTACRVLVVDDNVDAAKSLALLLKMSGHEVQVAYDGPGALQAAQAMRPDVVLLDIGLPGLTGYEVAEQMRQQPAFRNTVLVALTGYGREADRQRSRDAGFDHHLVKPADFREVEKILAAVAKRAA